MFITSPEHLKQYASPHRLWQGIPSIERTRGGRIFVSFYSGMDTERNGNSGVLVMSDDGGKTFSEPIAVADMGQEERAYDCCLWIDPTGRLWFIWSVMPNNRIECARCADPDATPPVWEPVRTPDCWDVMLNKPIVTAKGDWLFPCAVWKNGLTTGSAGGSDGAHPSGAHVFCSRDRGETFERLGAAIAADRHFDEHMLIEKQNGELDMYIRTKYGVARSTSSDGGRTWSEGYDCGYGGPNSRFYIGRLRSGRLLLVNHYRFCGRSNLYAMLSEDEGETFVGRLLLDGRRNISYPDVTKGENGFLYIVYDRERGARYRPDWDYSQAAREILMAKITEEDILRGSLTHPESRLQMIVSRLGYRPEPAV